MPLDPATEPAIDTSLSYYMEARALAIAREKAKDAGQRAGVERLSALRDALMRRRDDFDREAVAKRHARGEVYSAARVAAINAMGPGKAGIEELVQSLYEHEDDALGVLKNHARTHFAYGLVSQRLLLASHTPDIMHAARAMRAHEEAFASAWVATIGDRDFADELRRLQREALLVLRTSTRPMHLVTQPALALFDDADAQSMGKAWSRLDELATALGVEPLSNWIGLPDEGDAAGVAARLMLPTVDALIGAIASPGGKFPAKRATLLALNRVRDALGALDAAGRVHFEVDI